MQTIIATVGISLLTNGNHDDRPWNRDNLPTVDQALAWMLDGTDDADMLGAKLCRISAETNTCWHLDPGTKDRIYLLHSATTEGRLCAEALRPFLHAVYGIPVEIEEISGVDYEVDPNGSPLLELAKIVLKIRRKHAGDNIALAASGGFKAESMMLAVIGQMYEMDVYYIHEQYRELIYIPKLLKAQDTVTTQLPVVPLPDSAIPRDKVSNLSEEEHHRTKNCKAVLRRLLQLPWVEEISPLKSGSAPDNGVKFARLNSSGNHQFAITLFDGHERMYLTVATTGHEDRHREAALIAFRHIISR